MGTNVTAGPKDDDDDEVVHRNGDEERDWRLENDDQYSINDAIADREREEAAERSRNEELGLDE